jgi:predicted AAA+ superfamily ATPase
MDDATRDRILHFIGDSIAPPPASNTRRVIRGPHSLPNKATAVIGMRRAGKTTFLHQMRSERIAAGIAAAQLPYWNFEDDRISGLRAEQLHLLLSEYFRQHPDLRQRQTVTLCLDEIQVVPGWERFVRRLLDTEKVEIFLSGSSAAMLSREVATSMRGRGWEVVVHPFSFAEALAHQGDAALLAATAPTSRRRSLLEKRLIDYLAIGGFPEVQDVDDATRNRILLDYVDVVMLRDVVERHEITGNTALRWLVRHLLGNAGGSFSVQKFFDALKSQGLRLAKDSLHDLVAHLNDCFLVRTVWLETESERRRMVNPRKIYPVDPAFIRLFDPARRANVGHTLEAAVLIELERRGAAVTYVRTEAGHEVDFLARFPDGTVELIQVAAAAVQERTMEREVRALAEAKPSFPGCTAHLVVLDQDGLPPSLPRGITAHAATEWLLGGD